MLKINGLIILLKNSIFIKAINKEEYRAEEHYIED